MRIIIFSRERNLNMEVQKSIPFVARGAQWKIRRPSKSSLLELGPPMRVMVGENNEDDPEIDRDESSSVSKRGATPQPKNANTKSGPTTKDCVSKENTVPPAQRSTPSTRTHTNARKVGSSKREASTMTRGVVRRTPNHTPCPTYPSSMCDTHGDGQWPERGITPSSTFPVTQSPMLRELSNVNVHTHSHARDTHAKEMNKQISHRKPPLLLAQKKRDGEGESHTGTRMRRTENGSQTRVHECKENCTIDKQPQNSCTHLPPSLPPLHPPVTTSNPHPLPISNPPLPDLPPPPPPPPNSLPPPSSSDTPSPSSDNPLPPPPPSNIAHPPPFFDNPPPPSFSSDDPHPSSTRALPPFPNHLPPPPCSTDPPPPSSSSNPPYTNDPSPPQLCNNLFLFPATGDDVIVMRSPNEERRFKKLCLLGRGGSSKVFKVISEDYQIFALKEVYLRNVEKAIQNAYVTEIKFLRRLKNQTEIITLHDYSWDNNERILHLLLEFAESDLSSVIKQRKPSLPMALYFWNEMLRIIEVIHREGIIHNDLKPENFVCIKGRLKLIDFGIANRIEDEHTSVERDMRCGTVNYMSPETIETYEDKDYFKVGRPSDIWSLGCILYQMVYGRTPFEGYKKVLKWQAIVDPSVSIPFSDVGNPAALDVMKKCLKRNPKERPTVEELLSHPFTLYQTS